ncbi:zinc finger, C2H2 type protein [Rhizoctonia solani AG-3 Rhs1AP]|uniref:Zinc finger, C2H2 type protein n=2 Tax=Rhizoctonia solani AG-3 TaxID=1086053 RepID=A0A074RWX6_9AGAM|nr:zinc finger, C2H2 type protein [Rhizoctonia solani AG-3 Rhs1AP]KEP49785.1 zinc finger, C2H2 type protein [Rhizoctonia solani 123E]
MIQLPRSSTDRSSTPGSTYECFISDYPSTLSDDSSTYTPMDCTVGTSDQSVIDIDESVSDGPSSVGPDDDADFFTVPATVRTGHSADFSGTSQETYGMINGIGNPEFFRRGASTRYISLLRSGPKQPYPLTTPIQQTTATNECVRICLHEGCEKTFVNKSAMEDHANREHNANGHYPCLREGCGRSYRHWTSLMKHEDVHIGKRVE